LFSFDCQAFEEAAFLHKTQNDSEHTEVRKYEGWNFNSGNTAVETPCYGTK